MISHPLKNKIKASFNQAWASYDDHALLQKKICTELVNLLKFNTKIYDHIADIACGTGISTEALITACQPSTLYAIDFSEQLLQRAQRKLIHSNTQFMLADFDEIFLPKHTLDLMFSSMGLQWSLNLKETLHHLHSFIQPRGSLAFAIPVDGTFPELHSTSKNILHRASSLESILAATGFKHHSITTQTYIESFTSQKEALYSIKNIGAHCKLNQTKTQSLNPYINPDRTTLTYEICFVIAQVQ
ncbi:MAG: methyltransferase domain-containing protein [Legionellaceae bacterium]